jgi:O-antigen ligase
MCFILSGQPQIRFLLDDIRPAEKDGVNLKQRYVEWQAELNLLEERTMTGTGAGCINDYRSSFYYRLPKLNTLKPFDQNGYLATAAETGVLGLVCFLWVVLRYGRLAVSSLLGAIGSESAQSRRFAAAGLAGLVAICTANMFSSVHYNGVLIAFVMVLALIARSRAVFGGD